MKISRQHCLELDAADPMAHCASRFVLPPGKIYLDGNSLGALPKGTSELIAGVVEQEWGNDLIQSWNTAGWFELPVKLGDRISNLVGAAAGQIVVCDNTSINLYKTLHAALGINADRNLILADRGDFPTDLYMIEGAAQSCGRPVEVRLIDDTANIVDQFDQRCAVAVLSEVNYRTGLRLDMQTVTSAAHKLGILVIWDLCHSVGAMPVALDDAEADFAVGCSYKFLNGGPGAPAFVYVARRHHSTMRQPLQGWWSHQDPFGFAPEYAPTTGIKRMLSGTQPVLSMRAIACGLGTFDGVDLQALREKSGQMCRLFIDLVEQECSQYGVALFGPKEPARRGSHVALSFEHGYSVVQAMIARGVIGDFRAPDLMRFGFAPLYLSFAQLFDAVRIMRESIEQEPWLDSRFNHVGAVT